jgi:hypothetical protein
LPRSKGAGWILIDESRRIGPGFAPSGQTLSN